MHRKLTHFKRITEEGSMASSMEFIPGRKRAPQSLGRVLVLGLGKSGRVAAQYCAALLGTRVDALYVAAGSANDDARAFVEELSASASCADPCVCEFGDAAVPMLAKQAGGRFDLCIASPGIRLSSIKMLRRVPQKW